MPTQCQPGCACCAPPVGPEYDCGGACEDGSTPSVLEVLLPAMHLTPLAGTCCTDHPLLWELPFDPDSPTYGLCLWTLTVEHPCIGQSAYGSTVKAGSTLTMTATIEVDMGDVYLTISLAEVFGLTPDTGFPRNWGVRWRKFLWSIVPSPGNCTSGLVSEPVPFEDVGAGITEPLCLDGYGDAGDPAGDAEVTAAV